MSTIYVKTIRDMDDIHIGLNTIIQPNGYTQCARVRKIYLEKVKYTTLDLCDYRRGCWICILSIPSDVKISRIYNTIYYESPSFIVEKIMPIWDIYTIQYLISIGANIVSSDNYILPGAILDGYIDIVDYLISMKTPITHNIIYSVAVSGCVDIMRYIVSIGADIHADNDYALREASRAGNLEMVQYLVSVGADIHALNDNALRTACAYSRLDIVQYLVSVGANIHVDNDIALREASYKDGLETVQYLVSMGADIHALNDSALRIACANDNLNVVKYLVSIGADIRADNDGALREAYRSNNCRILHYLETLYAKKIR